MIRANQRPDSLHRRTGRYPQLHPRCGCLVHGYVLVEIARNPEARIRDISAAVALAERTVQALVAELGADGYRTRSRTSRRTVYAVHHDRLFRHTAQEGHRVGPFLDLQTAPESRRLPSRQGQPAARPNSPIAP
jgi:hypothetical protein